MATGPARSASPTLLWVLTILLALILAPYLIERIQYALVRGRATAEAEVARDKLAQMPAHAIGYADVVKAIAPSVVGVETTRVVETAENEQLPPLLRRRFPSLRSEGEGSGVIIDNEGYILTNNHVIDEATEVAVKLSDGRTIRDVTIVGKDPESDIALLKIATGGLMAAEWGDSDALKVGDPVLAVGSPFGLEQTVTAGILSAKGRSGVVQDVSYEDFLQTDAAVNPGNSGGPLVDLRGQVVGINTAIVGRAYQGISFSIPATMARRVYEELRSSGSVARGWLGVAVQPLTAELAEQFGLESTDGALVADLVAGAPAERSGIQPGDVILRVGEVDVVEPRDLIFAVADLEPGTRIPIELLRGGERRTIEVAIGQRPVQPTRR